MPEDHPWMLCCDDQRTQFESIRAALSHADLVVLLGTRLTHVATAGFRLTFAENRTVCVSESGAALPHGYQAAVTIQASIAAVLERLESEAPRFASCWSEADVREWRARFDSNMQTEPPEPVVNGGSAAEFFREMRSALPRDAIVVTDSGLHQTLVRRHFPVLGPSGLVFPCELQSMGFGLPAAIGARLAQPKRVVVVVMGDGGFAMSGLELLTACRDDVPVIVVVFNDGKLNLIRLQQLREYGVAHGTDRRGPDLERFAAAVGVRFLVASPSASAAFRDAVASGETTIIEVVVGDSNKIRRVRATSYAKETLRRAIGPAIVNWLKRRFR
jgi:acetolactate synthase-1/2/3 large subunit